MKEKRIEEEEGKGKDGGKVDDKGGGTKKDQSRERWVD